MSYFLKNYAEYASDYYQSILDEIGVKISNKILSHKQFADIVSDKGIFAESGISLGNFKNDCGGFEIIKMAVDALGIKTLFYMKNKIYKPITFVVMEDCDPYDSYVHTDKHAKISIRVSCANQSKFTRELTCIETIFIVGDID